MELTGWLDHPVILPIDPARTAEVRLANDILAILELIIHSEEVPKSF
jgi:hypothetical protein